MPSSPTLSSSLPAGICLLLFCNGRGSARISANFLPCCSPASNIRVLSHFLSDQRLEWHLLTMLSRQNRRQHRAVSSAGGGWRSGQREAFLRNRSLKCCHMCSVSAAGTAWGYDLAGPAEQAPAGQCLYGDVLVALGSSGGILH